MNRPQTLLLLCCLGTVAAGAARADKAGDALLDKCIQAETKTQLVQADYSSEIVRGQQTVKIKGHFVLKKPNVAHIVYSGSGGEKDETVHSDGRNMLHYMESEKQYTKEAPDMSGGNVVRMANSLEAMVFFNPDMLNQFRGLGSGLKIVGNVNIGGVSCQALQATVRDGNIYKIYIGPDNLLHGITQIMGKGDRREVLESRLTGVRTDTASAQTAMNWTPPSKAKLVKRITYQASSGGSGASPGSGLLPVGSAAPAFDLPAVSGGNMALGTLTKATKVLLVNFWDLNCGFCRLELPELDKMLTEFKGKGFDIATVDIGDSASAIQAFWKEKNLHLRVLMDKDGKMAERYKVSGIPCNYLIGTDGKIIAHFEGFDEAGIRQALTKAGIK